jgi:hypothetical protein
MVNYSNSKVYKLVSKTNMDVLPYIGSTTKQYLCQRFNQHRTNYKNFLKGKYHYVSSFKLFEECGIDDIIIVLLEKVNANSKDELHTRERYYIENTVCVNKVKPIRTKEDDKKYEKERYEQNKEHFKEKYERNKEKILEYYKNKYKQNRDKILNQQKEKYEQNKEIISIRQKEKFTCLCGSILRKSDRKKHERTIKHLTLIEKRKEVFKN